MSKKNLYTIAVLLNGLTDEDTNCRINSMKRLTDISKELGHQRTRDELIPFVTETCTDDEDEVLMEFAYQMGKFHAYVGGLKYVSRLLEPLEVLCKVEESQVRDKAVESINNIIKTIKEENMNQLIAKHLFPLVKNLSENRWYTARSSSCGIIPFLYSLVSKDSRKTLRLIFAKLCKDQTPMVRRYAAKNLSLLIFTYEKEYVIGKEKECPSLFSLFDYLRKDDQDSVRLLTVNVCISFTKALSQKESTNLVLPIAKSLGKDKSWRVRYMVADIYFRFCQTVGKSVTQSELISLFSNLCLDKESEVRTAAAFQIAGVCSLLTKDQVVSQVLPTIRKLVKDSSEHVRSALASVIMSISSILGKDSTIKHLLEHFLTLLKDDFSEVRLNIISKLSDVNSVIGAELLSGSGLMPSICELAEDKQWRVRLSIIKYIPLLAKQLGKAYFNEKLRKLCIIWLSDSVYTIREAATKNIIELTKIFGEDWAKKHIIPEALKMKDYSNYLYRMIVLFMISGLSKIVSNDTINELLPTVVSMANDTVPNIKFNVAKTLETLLPKLDKVTIKKQVVPCLSKLEKDKDTDVKTFTKVALYKVKKLL